MLSILFHLLLTKITVFLYFLFLFRVIFNSFFVVPAVNETAKLKPVIAIPTGASITVASEDIDTPPLIADKTVKALSKKIKGNNIFRKYFTH